MIIYVYSLHVYIYIYIRIHIYCYMTPIFKGWQKTAFFWIDGSFVRPTLFLLAKPKEWIEQRISPPKVWLKSRIFTSPRWPYPKRIYFFVQIVGSLVCGHIFQKNSRFFCRELLILKISQNHKKKRHRK